MHSTAMSHEYMTMAANDRARQNHDALFPNHVSTLTADVMKVLHYGEESVSVALEEVDAQQ